MTLHFGTWLDILTNFHCVWSHHC